MAAVFAIMMGVPSALAGEGILFPKGQQLTSIVQINVSSLNYAQRVMISSLQGVVAKKSSKQIFMDEGGVPWRSFLTSRYGIPVTFQSNPALLLSQFKTNINGYILYNVTTNKDSVNAATSLCGPFNAIAVDASIEASVRAVGVTNIILDVRGRNEKWVYDNYKALFNAVQAVELSEDINYHLRDYAVMANSFVFYDNGALRQQILNEWPTGGRLMGYADVSVKGEYGARGPETYWEHHFIEDALLSHGFLRQQASWTIDFDRMVFVFER